MWLLLAFLSATLLGFYDVFKKQSLKDNAVLPVLFLNTLFSSLIFLPFILVSAFEPDILGGTIFNVPVAGWEQHKYIIIKSFIVLSSWIFGYFGMKHLPITIVGPINATRPVMVLVGAMLVFGERLNLYQWIGVMLAVASFFMLSRSGKKEGIDFKHNKWILFIVLAAVMGAISGLYDKFLMKQLNPMLVQSWYNVYQLFIMGTIVFLLWWPKRKSTTPFRWDWTIILISVFLSAADFVYFYALSYDDSMISIVSMVRRGSVIVSFIFGALGMDENNQVIPNLPEKLSGYGYISGIVTTDNLDGATPAAFFAHQPERGMSKEIWADLPNSKLTFFSAGSYELFEKQAPNVQKEIKKEFTIIEEPNDKAIKKSKKLGYLPTKSKTASVNENRGDFLPSTTQMAIDYLSSRSTNGFFLMVEGARIDKSAHSNDYSAVVREVLDFDKAVEAAIRFAEKDGNTLVIISADHETGALALRDGNIKEGKMKAMFVSKGHTPIMVPLFAYGPQSKLFGGVQENSDVSNKILQLLAK